MPTVNRKDPSGILDYLNDWSAWLGADTLATSTWVISTVVDDEDPLVEESETNTTTVATIWVSGGTVGNEYTLVNHITTAGGRTEDRTRTITIANR